MSVKVLVPYNFTVNDEKALDFIIERYRGDKNIKLTLYHGYHPAPEISVENNPIMNKMTRATSYVRQVLNQQKEELEQAKYQLTSKGFRSENIECLFAPLKEDLAKDVIRLIKTGHYDTVVLNRNPGNIINYFSRSLSKKIASLSATGVSIHIVN